MKYSDIKREIEQKYKKNDEYKPYKKIKAKKFSLDKKIILIGAGCSAVCLFIFFLFWASGEVEPKVNQDIKRWMSQSRGRNFEVNFFEYGDFRFSLGGAAFTQIRARGVIRYDYPYFQPRFFEIDIPILQISFRWGLFSGLRLGLGIDGLEIRGGKILPNVVESERRLESISKLTFQAWVPISASPLKWKGQLAEWLRQFKKWVFNGTRMRSVYMSGNATFLADGVSAKVYFLSSEDREGRTYLEGDENDMRHVARLIEPKFTESDVLVAAKNLLKTPKLLEVRTRADMSAEAIYKAESGISYDTFRHVFWSYYLTQTFGPDFAVLVTNAHEFDDPINTAKESERDRRNNAIGVEYAQRKLTEQEIEKIIFSDHRILQNQAS